MRRLLQQDAENSKNPTLLRSVWEVSPLCESPLEDILLLQMVLTLCPEFSIFDASLLVREKPARPHFLQIVPQHPLGSCRVDFLVKPGNHDGIVIECDGADYHLDAAKDARRDEYLCSTFGVSILRIPGNAIFGSSAAISLIAGLVRAAAGLVSGWQPEPGRIKVNWPKRIEEHPLSFCSKEILSRRYRAEIRAYQDGHK